MILNQLIREDDIGFEWGAGRSTVWFAERCSQLCSVEDSQNWHDRVIAILARKGLKNVTLHHCQVGSEQSDPAAESEYSDVINKFPDNHFGFVLVDGKSRDKCALNAISKLKSGGLLIIDNVNWYLPSRSKSPKSQTYGEAPSSQAWQKFADLTKNWRRIWASNGVFDTVVYFKEP